MRALPQSQRRPASLPNLVKNLERVAIGDSEPGSGVLEGASTSVQPKSNVANRDPLTSSPGNLRS